MKHEKLIENWKDAIALIVLIALIIGIIYCVFILPGPESHCTTGTWKEIFSIFSNIEP